MKMDIRKSCKNPIFIQYIVLFLLVLIVFAFADFYNLNNKCEKSYLLNTITNTAHELYNNIFMQDAEIYLSIQDINVNFNNCIYLDKISRTLVLTMQDKVVHFELNSNNANVDYNLVDMGKTIYIKQDNVDYIHLSTFCTFYDLIYYFDSDNNICIANSCANGTFNRGYVNFNSLSQNYSMHINTNEWEVQVILDDAYYETSNKYYTVNIYNDNLNYVGRILKKYIDVPKIERASEESDAFSDTFKSIIINNTDTQVDRRVDVNAISLIKLSSIDRKNKWY